VISARELDGAGPPELPDFSQPHVATAYSGGTLYRARAAIFAPARKSGI
jgi:hypothetical protein